MTAVFRSLDEVPRGFGPTVAAIGNFDGAHRAHRAILRAVEDEAHAANMRSVAITFHPHPQQHLNPERAPRLLSTLDQRIEALRTTRIDAIVVLPFDAALAGLSAEAFVRDVLVERLGVRSLHEGDNFRFGHQAQAGIRELAQLGARFDFSVHVHPPVTLHGRAVSSSAIRALVAAGDVRGARWMLGRPFTFRSTQIRGRGIGSRLLVPTINLEPSDRQLPAIGVYISCLTIDARVFQSITNVGNRPTIGEDSFSVESHILNFEPVDISENTVIDLTFLYRVRNEMKFASTDALKEQIFKDVAKASRYHRLAKALNLCRS